MFSSTGSKMKNWTPDLEKILKKGIISPRLREAVEAMVQALKDKDLNLAYQLSACKSHITGIINPKNKTYAFQEDHNNNKKALTASVYEILDFFHHDMAWAINAMPSGMVMLSSNGRMSEMKPKGTHPIVRRVQFEHRQCMKRAAERN